MGHSSERRPPSAGPPRPSPVAASSTPPLTRTLAACPTCLYALRSGTFSRLISTSRTTSLRGISNSQQLTASPLRFAPAHMAIAPRETNLTWAVVRYGKLKRCSVVQAQKLLVLPPSHGTRCQSKTWMLPVGDSLKNNRKSYNETLGSVPLQASPSQPASQPQLT